MIWIILVVVYIVSVALSIVGVRMFNRIECQHPAMSDVIITLTPIMNVVVAIAVFAYLIRAKSHMPRFLRRLYGGE